MDKRKIITIIALIIVGSQSLFAQKLDTGVLEWTPSDVIGRNLIGEFSRLDTMQVKKIPAIVIRRQKWSLVDMENKHIRDMRDLESHVSYENGNICIDFDSAEDIVNEKSHLFGWVAKTFEQTIVDSTYLFCVACLTFGLPSTRISVFTKTESGYRLHSIGDNWGSRFHEFVFNVNGKDYLLHI